MRGGVILWSLDKNQHKKYQNSERGLFHCSIIASYSHLEEYEGIVSGACMSRVSPKITLGH